MPKKTRRKKQDTSWIWMLAITGIALIYAIVFIAGRLINGQTQVNGQAQISGRRQVNGQTQGHPLGHRSVPTETQDKYYPPTLKSLIVNSDSSQNYFDFILDSGDHEDTNTKISDNGQNDNGQGQALSLQPVARDLINYFFLGITLPPEDLWVNLNPIQPERITNPTLGKTDIGKILLEADLRMKQDVARFTDPRTTIGAEYWKKLNRELRKNGFSPPQIPGGNRVWIVPDKAIVEEDKETNKVTIVNSRLKVLIESEYFNEQPQISGRTQGPPLHSTAFQAADPTAQAIQDIASKVMKEVIIPTLEDNINHAKPYAQLKQVYTSLILAAYFKQKYKNDNSFYSQIINKGYLGSLKSTKPWSKQKIFDAYIQSAQQGEHSLTQSEYDPYQSGFVQKQYFSGGVRLAPEQVLKIQIQPQESASPLNSQDNQGNDLILLKVSSPLQDDQGSFWEYTVALAKLPYPEETPVMVAEESQLAASPVEEMLVDTLKDKRKRIIEEMPILALSINIALQFPDQPAQNYDEIKETFFKLLRVKRGLAAPEQIEHIKEDAFNMFWRHNVIALVGTIANINESDVEGLEKEINDHKKILNYFFKWIRLNEKKITKYFPLLTSTEEKGLRERIKKEYNHRRPGMKIISAIEEMKSYVSAASPLTEEKQTPKIAPGGIDLGDMEIEVREK